MAHRFLNNPLYLMYRELLELMDRGRFEEISERIREIRQRDIASDDLEALRRLISARIAIFKGQPPEELQLAPAERTRNPWIAGEAAMVLGIHKFHIGDHLGGSSLFEEAAKVFEGIGMMDRQMIAAFNAIIGKVNANAYQNPASQLDALMVLEKKIRLHPDASSAYSALACLLRQKCYVFQEQGRLHAAFHEINESIPLFRDFGTQSDYQLALLQAADLAIDIDQILLARQFFERVVPPVEVRVEFPLAWISWRLAGGRSGSLAPPDPGIYEFVSPYWLDKLRNHFSTHDKPGGRPDAREPGSNRTLTWNLMTGDMHDERSGSRHLIKTASLEGRLLRALMRARSSKALLSEILWPEQHMVRAVDDRFHRLVSRLNKKLGNVIEFDGQFYRLNVEVIPSEDV